MPTIKPPVDKMMTSHLITGIQPTPEITYILIIFQKMVAVARIELGTL
jgi:hypothetical protein